jgi:transcriptional regulator with XRE-family HTH domain
MDFSNKLKELRKEKGLSQKVLGDFLGVTRQAVAAYEKDKRQPGYETLLKLSNYFNVSADYLLGRIESKDIDTFTIGENLRIIRGDLSYEELSDRIGRKLGAMILPDALEAYEKAKRKPVKAVVKVLANYAGVTNDFFYRNNSEVDLEKEKELTQNENNITVFFEGIDTKKSAKPEMFNSLSNVNDFDYGSIAEKMDVSVETVKGIIASYIHKS